MKFTFLRYVIYAALTYGIMELMRYDGMITTDEVKFAESSLVEQAQNVIITLAVLILAFTKGYQAIKYILILILGMFLIREQDAFLDSAIAEHAWKYICIVFAVITGIKIFTIRKKIISEIEEFITTSSSGILFLGFLTLLVFSRMFGRKKFWKVVEGTEDYTRNVKNAAEECTELFAYFLILIGVVEFFFYVKSHIKLQKQIITE